MYHMHVCIIDLRLSHHFPEIHVRPEMLPAFIPVYMDVVQMHACQLYTCVIYNSGRGLAHKTRFTMIVFDISFLAMPL